MLRITILTDNMAKNRGLLAEHGLSLWIEHGDRKILFDTGQSAVCYHNAKEMNIDLGMADYIVLSHGHYDHCGGLQHFPYADKIPTIYAHPGVFSKKYVTVGKNEPLQEIGVPWEKEELAWLNGHLFCTRQPLMLEDGVWLSGEIPANTSFEATSNDFYVEKDGRIIHDAMLDEQMLIMETGNGLAVLLGCSHPGVINCLNYVQTIFPDKNIDLLIAGMHLGNVGLQHLQMTIQCLSDMNIQKVVPLHCTGVRAIGEMKRILGDRCLLCTVGDTVEV